MPTTVVRVPGTAQPATGGTSLVITVWQRNIRSIVLPWMPDEIESSGLGRTWAETPRPGRAPLQADTGPQTERHALTVRVCAADVDQPIHRILDALRDACASGRFVVVGVASQPLGRGGLFRITDMRIRIADHGIDGRPVDATIDLEFTRATLVSDPVGPVRGKRKR
jgi:hypothetical protein